MLAILTGWEDGDLTRWWRQGVVFVELDVDFLMCKVLDVSGMQIDFIIVLHHRTSTFVSMALSQAYK